MWMTSNLINQPGIVPKNWRGWNMTIVMVKGRALRELILAEAPNQAAIRKASPDPGNPIAEAAVQASTLTKEAGRSLRPSRWNDSKRCASILRNSSTRRCANDGRKDMRFDQMASA